MEDMKKTYKEHIHYMIETISDEKPLKSIYHFVLVIHKKHTNNERSCRATKIKELIELVERIPDKRLDALLCWANQYQEEEND